MRGSWKSEPHEDTGGGLGLALGSGQPLQPGWRYLISPWSPIPRSPSSASTQGQGQLHRLGASPASPSPSEVKTGSGPAIE